MLERLLDTVQRTYRTCMLKRENVTFKPNAKHLRALIEDSASLSGTLQLEQHPHHLHPSWKTY